MYKRQPDTGPKRQTVAIVDDRLTNLKILERLARSLDSVEVAIFERPQAALDAATALPPDLVITDFNMPELDGAEFIRQFRAVPGCADVDVYKRQIQRCHADPGNQRPIRR